MFYRKDTPNAAAVDTSDKSLKAKLSLKGKCSRCDKQISLYTQYNNGRMNRQPYKMCKKCHKELKSESSDITANSIPSEGNLIASFIGSIDAHSDFSFISAVEGSSEMPFEDPDVIILEPGEI